MTCCGSKAKYFILWEPPHDELYKTTSSSAPPTQQGSPCYQDIARWYFARWVCWMVMSKRSWGYRIRRTSTAKTKEKQKLKRRETKYTKLFLVSEESGTSLGQIRWEIYILYSTAETDASKVNAANVSWLKETHAKQNVVILISGNLHAAAQLAAIHHKYISRIRTQTVRRRTMLGRRDAMHALHMPLLKQGVTKQEWNLASIVGGWSITGFYYLLIL